MNNIFNHNQRKWHWKYAILYGKSTAINICLYTAAKSCSTAWEFSSQCNTVTVGLCLPAAAWSDAICFLNRDRERDTELESKRQEWWCGGWTVSHTHDITNTPHWGHSVSYSNWLWCDPFPRNPGPLLSQPHDCTLHKSLQAPAGSELW